MRERRATGPVRTGRWDRICWSVVLAAVLVALGLAAHRAFASPSGRLFLQDPRAPWIMPATGIDTRLQQWRRVEAPVAEFVAELEVGRPVGRSEVLVRSFGELDLSINGEKVSIGDAGSGELSRNPHRFSRTDVTSLLRAGRNTLEARVSNLRGPPLLSLRLEDARGTALLSTSDPWRVRLESGVEVEAVTARDDGTHPESYLSPRPLEALVSKWVSIGTLALVSWLGVVAYRSRSARLRSRLPAAALAAASAAWLVLGLVSFRWIPLATGFDAGNHLDYVNLIRAERWLPHPMQAWSTHHPPLFYALSAVSAELGDRLGAPPEGVLKLIPWLAGLGQAWIALALARRLLPGAPVAWASATLFAALVPVNLYIGAYLSNEGLHGLLAACVILMAVDLLMGEPRGVGDARLASFSALAGLALLTKFTAVFAVGVTGIAVGARVVQLRLGSPAALARGVAALVLPALALSGWFYVRSIWLYGLPMAGNWNLSGSGLAWWSYPGFHTPAYYLSVGESLVHPFYAALSSFWDALYSTLWGDGLLGGRTGWMSRHPHWSYEVMAVGYLLAVPASALVAWGLARAVRTALRDPVPGRRAAAGLLVVLVATYGFAIFYATLTLPFAGQARASYATALVPVLAVFFASGLQQVDRRLAAAGWETGRVVLATYVGVLLGVFLLGFLPRA